MPPADDGWISGSCSSQNLPRVLHIPREPADPLEEQERIDRIKRELPVYLAEQRRRPADGGHIE